MSSLDIPTWPLLTARCDSSPHQGPGRQGGVAAGVAGAGAESCRCKARWGHHRSRTFPATQACQLTRQKST